MQNETVQQEGVGHLVLDAWYEEKKNSQDRE